MLELIHAHRSVLERMNAPDNQGRLRQLGDAQMTALLTEGWRLAGEWAAGWLDCHPDPPARDLENLFVDFTPPPAQPELYDPKQPELFAMEGSATRIGTDVYVVTAVYENYTATATATFFVVARGADGHFRAKWSVKPLAERHYRSKDEIGLWAFLGSCAYYCGPLVVDKVMVLPPSGKGQPRFAIDAVQATNGNTLMKQLGVWQWNGAEAENLVIRSYRLYIDEDRDIQLVGNLLTVPTKEATRSFSSFGCCAEPRGIWGLRITPIKDRTLATASYNRKLNGRIDCWRQAERRRRRRQKALLPRPCSPFSDALKLMLSLSTSAMCSATEGRALSKSPSKKAQNFGLRIGSGMASRTSPTFASNKVHIRIGGTYLHLETRDGWWTTCPRRRERESKGCATRPRLLSASGIATSAP
jgi:hypothetical protein